MQWCRHFLSLPLLKSKCLPLHTPPPLLHTVSLHSMTVRCVINLACRTKHAYMYLACTSCTRSGIRSEIYTYIMDTSKLEKVDVGVVELSSCQHSTLAMPILITVHWQTHHGSFTRVPLRIHRQPINQALMQAKGVRSVCERRCEGPLIGSSLVLSKRRLSLFNAKL